MAPATLTALPNEIFLIVTSWAEVEPHPPDAELERSGTPCPEWQNEEYPVLHSLRLVNKQFYALLTPRLFKTVTLLHRTDSWGKANLIAMSELAVFVKIIRVATNEDFPLPGRVEDWEQNVPYARQTRECLLYSSLPWRSQRFWSPAKEIHWQKIAAGGPFAKKNISIKEKARALWQYWEDGEVGMRSHYAKKTCPPFRIDRFVNLECIQTVGLPQLSGLSGTKTMLDPGKYDPAKMYSMKTPTVATGRAIEESYLDRWDIQWYNMRTLLSAAKTFGVQITELSVIDPREMHSEADLPGITFPSPRRLKLEFPWFDFRKKRKRTRAPWISNLSNLEELVVAPYQIHRDSHLGIDTFQFLENVKFPKLRVLEVEVVKTSFKPLDAFIQAHIETLKRLRVTHPRMSHKDFTKLRLKYSKVEGLDTILSKERLEVIEEEEFQFRLRLA